MLSWKDVVLKVALLLFLIVALVVRKELIEGEWLLTIVTNNRVFFFMGVNMLVNIWCLGKPQRTSFYRASIGLLTCVYSDVVEDVVPLSLHSVAASIFTNKYLRPPTSSWIVIFYEGEFIWSGHNDLLFQFFQINLITFQNFKQNCVIEANELSVVGDHSFILIFFSLFSGIKIILVS